MNHLWAPWRMAYIRSEKEAADGCVFCNKVRANDADEQIIARSRFVYVTLNRYPYNNGHLMVVPYEHVETQEKLSAEALTDLMLMINRGLAALRFVYNPQGFNLGANLGLAAGAGIADHYHFHIVPRWQGDSNFMTAVSETRVIPASLEETYRDLLAAWEQV
ncbi:MAG: HIT domain-containing protein [Anaerolineae bacterium]|nr:HIT domain-containing protein [Anaerolineae bacterium]